MQHDRISVPKLLDRAKAAGRSALTAPESKGICDAYGIAVPKEGVAADAGDIVANARRYDLKASIDVGPALAGTIIGVAGIAAPFWLNALSNLGVIGALLW